MVYLKICIPNRTESREIVEDCEKKGGIVLRWKVLGLVLFALVVAVFTLNNSTKVTVNFLFADVQVNLILVILISVLLGMILMALLWSIRAWKLRGVYGGLRRKVAELEHMVELHQAQVEEAPSDEEAKESPVPQVGGMEEKSENPSKNELPHE